jgi:hypothetical protein
MRPALPSTGERRQFASVNTIFADWVDVSFSVFWGITFLALHFLSKCPEMGQVLGLSLRCLGRYERLEGRCGVERGQNFTTSLYRRS